MRGKDRLIHLTPVFGKSALITMRVEPSVNRNALRSRPVPELALEH